VNLKRRSKNIDPSVTLIKKDEIPILNNPSEGIKVKVISGTVQCGDDIVVGPGSSVADSSVSIMHAYLEGGRQCTMKTGRTNTVLVYVRRGSLFLSPAEGSGELRAGNYMVFQYPFGSSDGSISANVGIDTGLFTLNAGPDGFDGLILIAEPLNERYLFCALLTYS